MAFNFISLIYIRNVNCLQTVKRKISLRLIYREGKTKFLCAKYAVWKKSNTI